MSVSEKIKALLAIRGKKQVELADHLGMNRQALNNKFNRGSFSSKDLIEIADFLECELAFIVDENQKIILDNNDIKQKDNTIG